MRWGYGGNPAGSVSDEVRFLVGDTNPCDKLLDDNEVAYCLQSNGNAALPAAIAAARALMMRYARAVDETVGPVSISWSQRFSNMQAVLEDLLDRTGTGNAVMWAGYSSASETRAIESDPDRVPFWFDRRSLQDPSLNAGDRPHSEIGGWNPDPTIEGNEPT